MRNRVPWLAAGRGRDLRLFVLSVAAIVTPVVPMALSSALLLIVLLTNGVVAARVVLSWRLSRPWSLAGTQAIVFDLDGTVADTMPFLTDLAVELLSRYELTPGDARSLYLGTVGIDFAGQLEEFLPGHPLNGELAAEFETRKRAGLLRFRVFADVTDTLALLRAPESAGSPAAAPPGSWWLPTYTGTGWTPRSTTTPGSSRDAARIGKWSCAGVCLLD